jgi:hypothetical protein
MLLDERTNDESGNPMIKSEAYYRAECDHEGCEASLPDLDEHDASGWPLDSVKDALRDERGDRDETWTTVGDFGIRSHEHFWVSLPEAPAHEFRCGCGSSAVERDGEIVVVEEVVA